MASTSRPAPNNYGRHYCNFLNCRKSFSRHADMLRHCEEQHQPPRRCPYPECSFSGKRTARVIEHMQKVHDYQVNTATSSSGGLSVQLPPNIGHSTTRPDDYASSQEPYLGILSGEAPFPNDFSELEKPPSHSGNLQDPDVSSISPPQVSLSSSQYSTTISGNLSQSTISTSWTPAPYSGHYDYAQNNEYSQQQGTITQRPYAPEAIYSSQTQMQTHQLPLAPPITPNTMQTVQAFQTSSPYALAQQPVYGSQSGSSTQTIDQLHSVPDDMLYSTWDGNSDVYSSSYGMGSPSMSRNTNLHSQSHFPPSSTVNNGYSYTLPGQHRSTGPLHTDLGRLDINHAHDDEYYPGSE